MSLFDEVTKIADLEIKQGQSQSARLRLRALKKVTLNPLQREKLASLYRRLNQHRIALLVLRPIVIGSARTIAKDCATAKIEYGASLIQLDSIEAGRSFLLLKETRSLREARWWYALSFLHDYQFKQAIKHIRSLMSEYDPSTYEHLVLQINLLVALLGDLHHPDSQRTFKVVSQEANEALRHHQTIPLKAAFYSIQIQSVFFSQSRQKLDVPKILPKTYLEFFAHFAAVLHEGRMGRITKTLMSEHYLVLRDFAIHQRWYEGLRELDLHYGRIFEPRLVPWVKMGTRFPHYQERFLAKIKIDQHLCFDRHQSIPLNALLSSAHEIKAMPEPAKLRRLFRFLLLEQYTPLTSFAIWSELQGDEYFIEPYSSNRVYQWVKRLKAWILKNKIPARIAVSEQGYRLVPSVLLKLRLDLFESKGVALDFKSLIQTHFKSGGRFNMSELSRVAPGLSRRELQYRLKELIEAGGIRRKGKARATYYELLEVK